MRRLKYFFGNPFADPRISLADLIAFSTDVIQRLTSNNPENQLDGVINSLSGALSRLHEVTNSDFTMLGVRKGAKFSKNEFREALPSHIRKIYAVVLAEFDDPSPEMKEIFPKNRSLFARARDEELITCFGGLISGLKKYQAQLGGEMLAKAEQLRDKWVGIHGRSERVTGLKSATEAQRRQAREELSLELFKTMGVLITLFPDDSERHRLYMQQHLIDGLKRKGKIDSEHPEEPDEEDVSGEGIEAVSSDSSPNWSDSRCESIGVSTIKQGSFTEETLLPRATGT